MIDYWASIKFVQIIGSENFENFRSPFPIVQLLQSLESNCTVLSVLLLCPPFEEVGVFWFANVNLSVSQTVDQKVSDK